MIANHHLHQLIQSLHKQEKRYFKVYAARHGSSKSNNYMRLFDAIARQDSYDEGELVHQFRKEALGKYFASIKYQLYGLLLKSLHAYHAGSSADAQIKEQLHYVEILYRKALYGQCRRILDKVRLLAHRYEKQTMMPEIIRWERRITEEDMGTVASQQKLEESLLEERSALESLRTMGDYWKVSTRMFGLLRKHGVVRNEEEATIYKEAAKHPLIQRPPEKGFDVQLYYLNVWANYYHARGEVKKSHSFRRQMVAWMEAHPHQIAEEPQRFVSILNNYIVICIHLKRFAEALKELARMRMVKADSENLRVRIFASSYALELDVYIYQSEFHKAARVIPEIQSGIKKYSSKMREADLVVFYYDFCSVHLALGDYTQSLSWANKMIHDTHGNVRPDLQCYTRLLHLIIHYELGNYDLLDYLVKSTYRFLYKYKRLFKFETAILNFMRRRLPAIHSERELLAAFQDLWAQMNEITKDPYEKKALEYFDFLSWLQSKIQKRTFAEVAAGKPAT